MLNPAKMPISFLRGDVLFGDHGPAYGMLVILLWRMVSKLGTSFLQVEFNHLISFLFFQVGVIAFYSLCKRWFSPWAAFGATLLFATQPLIWGHAFINPKDIPFMALFIVSVATGLWMLDEINEQSNQHISTFKIPDEHKSAHLEILKAFLSLRVLVAGFVLGFAIAVRVIAPLAAFIVVTYALLHKGKYSLPRLLTYILLAALVTLGLWPYLWPAPLDRFLFSLVNSSAYPLPVEILFAGRIYTPSDIPRWYLPILLGLQLTETTLLLSGLGVCILFASALKKHIAWDLSLLLLEWFFLPLTWFVVSRTTLFDNFRHVLFILPPLFILIGMTLDWISTRLISPIMRSMILTIALLPALIAGIRLHPYQYVYYNQLIGGPKGAFRHFQLDYWCISYHEAAVYINRVAPENARVLPIGPYQVMQFYVRPDIELIDPYSLTDVDWAKYDYLVVSTRNNQDLNFLEFKTVYSIERDNATLAVVKQP